MSRASPAQREHRLQFKDAIKAWRELADDDRERYNKRAKRQGRAGYNLFVGEYLANARQ